MSETVDLISVALFNEDADTVWLPRGVAADRAKARYLGHQAFGRIGNDPAAFPTEYRVRKVWMHHRPDGEYDEWPWKRCEHDADDAVAMWEVSAA